ncbi:MAG: hypothetical protein ABOK23_10380 [Candidatus Methanoperedens sp.]|nr:hypothetical protein [Candidatus Methanoperedens sp.]
MSNIEEGKRWLNLEITDLPIEPLCYTEKKFEEMERKGTPFVNEILKGKLLYSAKDGVAVG